MVFFFTNARCFHCHVAIVVAVHHSLGNAAHLISLWLVSKYTYWSAPSATLLADCQKIMGLLEIELKLIQKSIVTSQGKSQSVESRMVK